MYGNAWYDYVIVNKKYLFLFDFHTNMLHICYDNRHITKENFITQNPSDDTGNELSFNEPIFFKNENELWMRCLLYGTDYVWLKYNFSTMECTLEPTVDNNWNYIWGGAMNGYDTYHFYSETNDIYFDFDYIYNENNERSVHNVDFRNYYNCYCYYMDSNGVAVLLDEDTYTSGLNTFSQYCLRGYVNAKDVVAYFDANYKQNKIDIDFTGSTLTYKLNDKTYTATSSPYVVTPEDISFTSTLTSCKYTFSDKTNLINVNNFFDTSNVTNMYGMFSGCNGLINLSEEAFNTSNVTNMESMFNNCSSLTELDLSSWNVSKVSNLKNIFKNCTSLQTLNINGWDLTSANDISYLFFNLSSLENISIENVNTSNITNMSSIFQGCSALTELDLSSWDMSKISYLTYAFSGCTSLQTLSIPIVPLNVKNYQYLFYGCSSLRSLTTNNFNTIYVTSMEGMFYNCSSLTELDLSSWKTSNVTSYGFREMFYGCTSLQTLNLSGWDLSKTYNNSNLSGMFGNCNNLTTIYAYGCNETTINKLNSVKPTNCTLVY